MEDAVYILSQSLLFNYTELQIPGFNESGYINVLYYYHNYK